jgi:hypothetical protein
MVMGGLAILALATMGGKKGGTAPALPSGEPGGGGALPPGVRTNTKAVGPLPVVLPEDLAEMLAKSLRDLTINDDGSVSGPVTAEAVQRATTVAAQIEAAGFPDAARAFRAFIAAAAKKVPSPPKDKQVQLPGIPQSVVDQINRTIALERDPAKLQAVLDAVKAMPQSAQRDLLIEMLSQTIKQVQAAAVLADTLKKTEEVLKSPGLPPVTTQPTPVVMTPPPAVVLPTQTLPEIVVTSPKPQGVPDSVEARRAVNTANHLRGLIVTNGGDVKKAKNREDKSLVMAMQRGEGLTPDGKTGPGTVLKMAKYTGDIPLVFYWPTSATQKNVLSFREALRELADLHERDGRTTIADKLRAAASRERGQAGIVGVMPA